MEAKYRRGFSSNFFFSSSIRAEMAMERPRLQTRDRGPKPKTGRKRIIHNADGTSRSEVTSSLDFSARHGLSSRACPVRFSLPSSATEFRPVLQQMRGLAKYIWVLVALVF